MQSGKPAEIGNSLNLSRRDFLRTAGLAMAGLSVTLLLPRTAQAEASLRISCKHCGALFQELPKPSDSLGAQPHCPNCGINLATGRFDLDGHSGQLRYSSRGKAGSKAAKAWDCVQVPFPNSQWVMQTEKPLAKLSEIVL
ncbi:MAG: twin-arginine translocation signal domain-containing protein [Kiritimatiellia bacterium]